MNKTLCFFLVSVAIPVVFCSGQQKLLVSATLAPAVSHTNYLNRYYYPNSDGQIVEPVYINGIRWSTGYSAGVSVLYHYAPGWSVSSGLLFQQLGIRQARQATAGNGTTVLRNRVVRIPLLIHYASSTQQLSPYFSFGMLMDLPLPARVIVYRTGESTQSLKLETLKRPIFHVLFGAGGQYRLNNRYSLMAQPTWTYTFGQLGGANAHNPSFEMGLLTQLAYTF